MSLKYRGKILEWQGHGILPAVFEAPEENKKEKNLWAWKGWKGEKREFQEMIRDNAEAQVKRALYMAVEELKEEARRFEADAVIFFWNQIDFDSDSDFRILAEGTSVQIQSKDSIRTSKKKADKFKI